MYLILNICVIALTFQLFDPNLLQIEYTSRLDFLWKTKFQSEQEEVETMGSVNKILLENILPAHVAAHFLSPNRKTDVRQMNKMNLFFS